MSDDEGEEGARLIEEKIRIEFELAGRPVEQIGWNLERGGVLSNYSSHVIHVTVGGRVLRLNDVPDERVQDYPGGSGNEILDAHIKKLARK